MRVRIVTVEMAEHEASDLDQNLDDLTQDEVLDYGTIVYDEVVDVDHETEQ